MKWKREKQKGIIGNECERDIKNENGKRNVSSISKPKKTNKNINETLPTHQFQSPSQSLYYKKSISRKKER